MIPYPESTRKRVAKNNARRSKFVPGKAGIGIITELTQRIKRILKMQDQTTFPTARSEFPFFAATIEVANSGRDVPTAIMVNPIILSEIQKY